MKFEIDNKKLLEINKLMNGFVSKSATRPILNAVHIICDKDKQTVLFESTNATKIARWVVEAKVIENGECSLLFSKTFMYMLKTIKDCIPFNVCVYEEAGTFKANINGNIILLEARKCEYPKTNGIFEQEMETYENEPLFDIANLESALKALREAGCDTVKLSIPKNEGGKVKMVCKPFFCKGEPIVCITTTMRECRY